MLRPRSGRVVDRPQSLGSRCLFDIMTSPRLARPAAACSYSTLRPSVVETCEVDHQPKDFIPSLIGRTARQHGPASGLVRRAVGPPAACSSPAVRQDNDAQNDRYRNDRGEPVHYAPIMHSGTVTRPSDGSRYSLVKPFREVAGSKTPGLLRTSMV